MCLAFGLLASTYAAGQVTVKELTATQETTYSIEVDSCRTSWTAAHTKLNQSVIQQRSSCTLPLNRQLELVEKLLVRVLQDKTTASNFKTLFLGGLSAYPEMRERLATLAKRSSDWDLADGRPQAGRLDAALMRLANQQEFLAGWQELFQRHGLRIAVSGIEEAVVSRAGDLPYFARLEPEGIKPGDKLPSNCLVWFSVQRTME
jgi:hypothetical protein